MSELPLLILLFRAPAHKVRIKGSGSVLEVSRLLSCGPTPTPFSYPTGRRGEQMVFHSARAGFRRQPHCVLALQAWALRFPHPKNGSSTRRKEGGRSQ